MLFIVISIIILLMIVVVYMRKLAPQQEQYIIGEKVEVVSVMDGDTMKVRYNGQIKKVRFLLIDTPEMYHKRIGEQPFAREAQQLSRMLIQNAQVVSIMFDPNEEREDRYGRLLAYVYADGQSIQELLLRSGYARVGYVYTKQAQYVDEFYAFQEEAKQAKRGIWRYAGYVTKKGFHAEAIPHWQPGKQVESVQLVTEPNLLAYQIKGNINPKGEKRYYKPGDPNYDQVNPEQLFMSEEEAKAAGFIRVFRP